MECNCYVRHLGTDGEALYATHRGAHALVCPWYAPSRDPADAANDGDMRRHFEAWTPAMLHAARPVS